MTPKLSPAQQRVIDLLKENPSAFIIKQRISDYLVAINTKKYNLCWIRIATLNALIRINLLTEFEKGKWRLK